MARKGTKTRVTAKQKSARRRNIRIAQASRKRGTSAQKGRATGKAPVKQAKTKGSAFKTRFKKSYKSLSFIKGKGERTRAALGEAGDLLKGKTKRGVARAQRVRGALNRSYKRKGRVEKIPKGHLGSSYKKRGWKVKGSYATRPLKIRDFGAVG